MLGRCFVELFGVGIVIEEFRDTIRPACEAPAVRAQPVSLKQATVERRFAKAGRGVSGAMLDDPALVIERPDGGHDSSAASTSPTRREDAYALHYSLPADWFSPSYDACPWPAASTYSEAAVGVDNKPAYTNFPAQFGRSGAQFIWSSNLVLDNDVIVRYTGPGPTPSTVPSPQASATQTPSPDPSPSPVPLARTWSLLPWLGAR